MITAFSQIGAVFLFALFVSCKPGQETVTYEGGVETTGKEYTERKVTTTVERRPSAPASEGARKLAEGAEARNQELKGDEPTPGESKD